MWQLQQVATFFQINLAISLQAWIYVEWYRVGEKAARSIVLEYPLPAQSKIGPLRSPLAHHSAPLLFSAGSNNEYWVNSRNAENY